MRKSHPHPAHRAPAEHSVFVSYTSTPSVVGSAPTHAHTFDPTIEAAHDVSGVTRLFQIRALDLEDLLFQRCQLFV
jgi:hypothetical protein